MPTDIQRRGLMLILSSPSGAGKTTISRLLCAQDEFITLSVSVTTRRPRAREKNGSDYHFVTKQDFGIMQNNGELLEFAKIFGNHYGTPRALVEASLMAGRDVLFDIDWQGTQQLQEVAIDDVVRVFILPPSAAALEERLTNRAQDSSKAVSMRMSKASGEISHYAEYDYIIVNKDIEASVRHVQSILHAERLKRIRQTGLSDFVKQLRASL